MKTTDYTTRCAWFTAAMLSMGLAVAQDSARRAPELRVLQLELSADKDGLQVGFEPSVGGIGLAIASASDRTHRVLAELPMILADIQDVFVFVLRDDTKLRLRYWVQDYYAQFVVLDDATGLPAASHVLTVAARIDQQNRRDQRPGDDDGQAAQDQRPGDDDGQAAQDQRPGDDDSQAAQDQAPASPDEGK